MKLKSKKTAKKARKFIQSKWVYFVVFFVTVILLLIILPFHNKELMCRMDEKDVIKAIPKALYEDKIDLRKEFIDVLYDREKLKEKSFRGIYITSFTFKSDYFDDLVDALLKSGGNAMVIDVEVSGGGLAFEPENQYLKEINPGDRSNDDYKKTIKELKDKGIYVIARQVIFNDPYTASKKPEWRIKTKEGGLFDSRWLDPSHPEVQEYNLLIMEEVAKLGFDEVQFDYIRFPAENHYSLNYYYDENEMERWEVISDFLKRASQIALKHRIDLGVDVFGATIWGDIDWYNIGQYIPDISRIVDVIYPMTYPSHVSPGYYGFSNPYGAPYSFVRESIKKFNEASNGNAEIRTWIQGFPRYIPNFGEWFIKDQVTATYDAGSNDFMIWSPGNKYEVSWSSLGLTP